MFNLMIVVLVAYLCYQRGSKYMLKARVLDKQTSTLNAYALFMTAGMVLGEYIGLTLAYQYAPESMTIHIASGAFCSILLGESFYLYNKRLVRKIPTMEQRKNF